MEFVNEHWKITPTERKELIKLESKMIESYVIAKSAKVYSNTKLGLFDVLRVIKHSMKKKTDVELIKQEIEEILRDEGLEINLLLNGFLTLEQTKNMWEAQVRRVYSTMEPVPQPPFFLDPVESDEEMFEMDDVEEKTAESPFLTQCHRCLTYNRVTTEIIGKDITCIQCHRVFMASQNSVVI